MVPITIRQYIKVIKYIYDKNLYIDDFIDLIKYIHEATLRYETFREWEQDIDAMISRWKKQKVS